MIADLFYRDPALLVALSALLVFIAGGFLAWQAKSGEIWEQVADGYKEQVVQRDATIARLRLDIGDLGKQVVSLREQVELFKGRDQTAVLKALESHEVNAQARVEKTHELLLRAVEALEGQATV